MKLFQFLVETLLSRCTLLSMAMLHEVPRDKGRYSKHPACDCCGKPCLDYGTDDRICGGGDGPGFYLCSRVRCGAKREKIETAGGLEALRTHYTAQREKNDAA